MNPKYLGDRIRYRREELHISQSALAKAINVDQTKISLIEKGERKICAATELPLIADTLKRPISWFFEEPNKPFNKQKYPPFIALLFQAHFPNRTFSKEFVEIVEKLMESAFLNYVNSQIGILELLVQPAMREKAKEKAALGVFSSLAPKDTNISYAPTMNDISKITNNSHKKGLKGGLEDLGLTQNPTPRRGLK